MLGFLPIKPRKKKPPVSSDAVNENADEDQRYRPIEWSLVRKILGSLAPYKKLYATGIALAMTHVFLDLLGPQFISTLTNFLVDFNNNASQVTGGNLVAGFINKITRFTTTEGMTQRGAIGHIAVIIVFWLTTLIISVSLQRLVIIVMSRAGESVQFDFRRRMFAHLQTLSMSYYDKTKLGRIISRMTSDINGMREVNVWGLAHIIVQTSIMVFAAAMLIYTDWRMFLAVAWLAPVIFFANRQFIKRSASQWQIVREGFTRVSTNLAENITGMRVVTAFNRQSPNLGAFNALQEMNTVNNVTASRINGVFQPILELIRFVGRITILMLGGYLIASHQLQGKGVGSVIQAYMYWDAFMNPIVFLGNFYNTLLQAMAGTERVFSLLELEPDVKDDLAAQPLPMIQGRVTFEDVKFGYKADRPVLHGVSFEAQPGQMFALVGHTGSGKSSIISLIARFYQPQSGRVLVDGHDLRHVTGDSLHRQMGLVLQQNYLFTGTVFDNIRYIRPEATKEEIIDAATRLGTHDAIASLSNGYDTDVGERGGNMSLGQRQLICFTRAFVADPRIFMLDEATSAVDTGTELLIQNSLEKLLAGRTTFVVAHRLSTIMKADCILVIDAGHIVERGRHEELVAAGGKYAHLYEQFVQSTE